MRIIDLSLGVAAARRGQCQTSQGPRQAGKLGLLGVMIAALLMAASPPAGSAIAQPASPPAAQLDDGRSVSDRLGVQVSIVSIPVTVETRTWAVGGILRVPDGPKDHKPWPAVLIVHGSSGVDSRGGWYAEHLNRAGFATLEIDLWAARGVTGPAGRPKSPVDTLPDAFAALNDLAGRSNIDPNRIGVMGFSWGGVVSMLSATAAVQARYGAPDRAFAAFAPLYPVCWAYNRVPGLEFKTLTGKPVFIQAGALDKYDDPDSCAQLLASLPTSSKALVQLITYPGATHAWDRREPDVVVDDPFSHKGKGGPTPFVFNLDVMRKSTAAVVAFFTRTLAGP